MSDCRIVTLFNCLFSQQMSKPYTLKKSLGQHFLHDENMCQQIVAQLEYTAGKKIVEIGPGGGAISKYLIAIEGIEYKAIEIDEEKYHYLEATYPAIKGKIILQDVLQASIPYEGGFSVIGNFPYNISTQIVFRTLEYRSQIPEFSGMFQKEVAERICSKKGSKVYGILSVLAQAFYDAEYLFTVDENVFNPPPKVKSGVLRLRRKENYELPCSEKLLFTVVKTAFQQRRKTMRNSLKTLNLSDNLREDTIFDLRPEQLSVEQFIELTQKIEANAI